MHVSREMPRQRRRLDSWKEIAAYFDRDERTVKRWEKEKGLPVHRLPENTGARVFAFSDELTEWMAFPEAPPRRSTEEKQPEAFELTPDQSGRRLVRSRRPLIIFVVLATAVAGLGGTIAYHHQRSLVGRSRAFTVVVGNPASGSTRFISKDVVAEELYLKGRYFWERRTPGDLTQAVEYFNQAIARDPEYADAYVGLANCYSLLREFSAMPSEEAFPRALAAARRATELDDTSATAHNALAFVTFYWNWDAEGAEREFRRAIELDPNYVTAHHWYATFLMVLGRFPEAVEQIERAQQLDPASAPILADKALILFHQGKQLEALSLLQQLSATQPDFFSTHQYLSHIYLHNRDYPNYLKELRIAANLSRNQNALATAQAAEEGYRAGKEREMFESILRMQKPFFENGKLSAFAVAMTFAATSDVAETLRYLNVSLRRHEVDFLSIRVDERFLFLHNNSAYRQLVDEAGLPSIR
jgi:tetratricopeptide (TPR) repeat protein